MDGFLNLLKPPGMTSSDAVVMVRRLCPKGTRVGHGGTLDPDAAGVLPICVGRAARLFDYMIDKNKRYVAELTLGAETDTQDATGKILREADASRVTSADVEGILPNFVGQIMQIPPQFSAIKRDGVRGYEAARAGKEIHIESRPVRVQNLSFIRQIGRGKFLIAVECGKGLYVRTLMHDIGHALGCFGHMSFLLRTSAGSFEIEDALCPEDVLQCEHVGTLLMPVDAPIAHLPRIDLPLSRGAAVRNGNPIRAEWLEGPLDRPQLPQRIYLDGHFAGIGERKDDGSVRFKAMLFAEGGA